MSTVDIKILDRAVSVSERAIDNLKTRLNRCETSKGYANAFHKFESSRTDNIAPGPGGVGVIDVSELDLSKNLSKDEISMRFDDETDLGMIVDKIITGASSKPKQSDDPSTYLSFPSDDRRKFVDEDRPFKDSMSDLVTTEFLKHDSTMKSFLYIFITMMANSIRLYMKKMNLQENHIMFLYKGVNVLRYILRQYIYEEIGIVADIIEKNFGTYFKKSDADFQININSRLDLIKDGLYDKVYEDMQLLAYHILYRVRNVYLLSDIHTLDFNKLKVKFSSIILKGYLEKIQNLPIIKSDDSTSVHKGIKILKLAYGDMSVGEELPDLPIREYSNGNEDYDQEPESNLKKSDIYNRKGSTRADIAIVNKENKESGKSELNIYKMKYMHRRGLNDLKDAQITDKYFAENDRDEMYISWNNSLEFNNTNEVGKIVKFALVRSKLNFKAFYVTADGKYKNCLNMGGEFLDISIPHKKGYESDHFFYHDNRFVPLEHSSEFRLVYQGDSSITKFYSYSLKYFIFDLNKMLFGEHPFVWEDTKYVKRLYRLFIFVLIETLYNTNQVLNRENVSKLLELNNKMDEFIRSLNGKIDDFHRYVSNNINTQSHEEIKNYLNRSIPEEINTLDFNSEKYWYEFCKKVLTNVLNLEVFKDKPSIDPKYTHKEMFIKLIKSLAPIFQSLREILTVKLESVSGSKLDIDRLLGLNMQGGFTEKNSLEKEFVNAYAKEYKKCKNKYLKLKYKH